MQAAQNLRYMGVRHARVDLDPYGAKASSCSVGLFRHDATQPFGWGDAAPDLVVANPPWGKNIGTGEDAVRIVRSLVRAFPRATCGLLVSEWTFNQLQHIQQQQQQSAGYRAGFRLVEHWPVGPNRLVVVRADDAGS